MKLPFSNFARKGSLSFAEVEGFCVHWRKRLARLPRTAANMAVTSICEPLLKELEDLTAQPQPEQPEKSPWQFGPRAKAIVASMMALLMPSHFAPGQPAPSLPAPAPPPASVPEPRPLPGRLGILGLLFGLRSDTMQNQPEKPGKPGTTAPTTNPNQPAPKTVSSLDTCRGMRRERIHSLLARVEPALGSSTAGSH